MYLALAKTLSRIKYPLYGIYPIPLLCVYISMSDTPNMECMELPC